MSSGYRPVIVVCLLAVLGGILYLRLNAHPVSLQQTRRERRAGCSQVAVAFRRHQSGVWVSLSARVTRLLTDTDGIRRHQRFIVTCPDGQTVLIVNDVSIGGRAPVAGGEPVSVRGQFIWNAEGGLVHFTHHDPSGGEGGWILLGGRVYSMITPHYLPPHLL